MLNDMDMAVFGKWCKWCKATRFWLPVLGVALLFNQQPVQAQSALNTGIANVSTGNLHSCALTATGGVKCWGNNANGQLGDGSTIDQYAPVNVVGLGTGVVAVATGGFHSCAVTAVGAARCWGANEGGQLGDGSATQRNSAVAVNTLGAGVSAVDAGVFFTCALTGAGGVKCWGDNGYGQLGDNTYTYHFVPADVLGMTSGIKAIAVGDYHACALSNAGGVKCWGNNSHGQMGDGTTVNRLVPVDVAGLASGIAAISAGGSHSCALTTAGEVKCWGSNEQGQIGDGTTSNRSQPVTVLANARATSAGDSHSCAVLAAGSIKCWGANHGGQLGDNTTIQQTRPVDAATLPPGMSTIAAGGAHSCALKVDGGLRCWGSSAFGQAGDNFSDMWWSGKSEDGWGMTIAQHGGVQFTVLFVYDADGKPLWVVMPGGKWNADFTTYTGDLYIPTGAPFSNYDTNLFNIGAKVGTLSATFTGASTAKLQYTINGVSGQKNIERMLFGPIDHTASYQAGDLWWGGNNQNGWGINITQQYRTLFAVWYTYDEARRPVWYVMSGGTWQGNTYVGDLYYTTSSPWVGAVYDPKRLGYTKVGNLQLNFSDANHATMTYTVNGITQSKPIVRMEY